MEKKHEATFSLKLWRQASLVCASSQERDRELCCHDPAPGVLLAREVG